ncbi:unnamed protein product [Calypogeia fissa]
MPLHRIFHPPGIFSGEDKKAIAERLTAIYTGFGIPAFYVDVLFIAVDEDSFYIGGKPTSKFVRIVSQHIARHVVTAKDKANRVQKLEDAFAPYIKDRGFDWELHVELHDRELWRVNGMVPPPTHSDGEKTWAKLNKAVPY